MQVQLQTLLGSGGESSLLGSCVIRELNTLVDAGEVDQRVEEADPVEATCQDLFLVDILR